MVQYYSGEEGATEIAHIPMIYYGVDIYILDMDSVSEGYVNIQASLVESSSEGLDAFRLFFKPYLSCLDQARYQVRHIFTTSVLH